MCGEGGFEIDVPRTVQAEANAWRLESGGGCDGRQAHIKPVECLSAQCVRKTIDYVLHKLYGNTGMPVWY